MVHDHTNIFTPQHRLCIVIFILARCPFELSTRLQMLHQYYDNLELQLLNDFEWNITCILNFIHKLGLTFSIENGWRLSEIWQVLIEKGGIGFIEISEGFKSLHQETVHLVSGFWRFFLFLEFLENPKTRESWDHIFVIICYIWTSLSATLVDVTWGFLRKRT